MIVRELRVGEWREARELRLRSLADAPAAFLRTRAEEAAYRDDVWRERAAARDARWTFVAETDGRLVGSATGLAAADAGAGAPPRRDVGRAGRPAPAVRSSRRRTGAWRPP